MEIIYDFPPVYEEVKKRFDIAGRAVVFAWGDSIYNPYHAGIDEALEAHERTHGEQQKMYGGPKEWWIRYLDDPAFRLEQEVEAYRVQYRFFCARNAGKNQRFEYLKKLASDLASPLYKVDISFMDAMRRIRE